MTNNGEMFSFKKQAYQNGLNKILIVRLVHEVRSCYL